MDGMIGCLKLLLNLTYSHEGACDRVRTYTHEGRNGLHIIFSLLNLFHTEKEKFDIQQHTLGLLINLVCHI